MGIIPSLRHGHQGRLSGRWYLLALLTKKAHTCPISGRRDCENDSRPWLMRLSLLLLSTQDSWGGQILPLITWLYAATMSNQLPPSPESPGGGLSPQSSMNCVLTPSLYETTYLRDVINRLYQDRYEQSIFWLSERGFYHWGSVAIWREGKNI